MKIALDPYMHRHLSLEELPRKVAELGYEWIELSPRDDFLAWWVHPRAYPERIASFKKSLKDHGVKIASLLPMYRWASPHEDERQTAVRYWKKAIEIAVEMGVDTMNSEFGRGPSPDRGHSAPIAAAASSPTRRAKPHGGARWRSLSPCSRRKAIQLNIEPHPEDWCETLHPARRHDPRRSARRPSSSSTARRIRSISATTSRKMIRDAGSLIAHVHVADTYNHKASSGLRYICNPPGAKVTIHQHMDIGQGEVNWDQFFSSLAAIGFDGIMTACVFAWEERADELRPLHARDDAEIRRQVLDEAESLKPSAAPAASDTLSSRTCENDPQCRRHRRRNDRPGAHPSAGEQTRRRESRRARRRQRQAGRRGRSRPARAPRSTRPARR